MVAHSARLDCSGVWIAFGSRWCSVSFASFDPAELDSVAVGATDCRFDCVWVKTADSVMRLEAEIVSKRVDQNWV